MGICACLAGDATGFVPECLKTHNQNLNNYNRQNGKSCIDIKKYDRIFRVKLMRTVVTVLCFACFNVGRIGRSLSFPVNAEVHLYDCDAS